VCDRIPISNVLSLNVLAGQDERSKLGALDWAVP